MHDLARYNRQILLPGIGEEGQIKLLNSSVLIVGCGALGTVIANMLARAGVGHLIIVDRDFIELTNLQRQVLFDEQDVADAIPKAEAAKRKLAGINSQVKVTAVVDDVNHTNIEKLLFMGLDADGNPGRKVDAIIDGVDNFETRYVANDAAVKHAIPYVYGGAVGTIGAAYAILPHSVPPDQTGETPWEKAGLATPCLRCIFEEAPPPGFNPTCDTAGVLGPVVSIVSNYQVIEAIKILTGNLAAVNPTMLSINVWENTTRQFKVKRAYDVSECVCCKKRKFEFLDGLFGSSTTTLCGRNAVQITQKGTSDKLKFDEIVTRIKPVSTNINANKFMLRADITDNGEPYELTLFTDGRAIIKGTKDAKVAKGIYAKYIGA
jgi:molybdopterin-synthase adenylyltransferase